MMLDWIKGTTKPPVSGNYYVIRRSLQDRKDPITGDSYIKIGEFVVEIDYWQEEWEKIGKNNPLWAIEAWANIPEPDIPEKLADKVRFYFGKHVGSSEV